MPALVPKSLATWPALRGPVPSASGRYPEGRPPAWIRLDGSDGSTGTVMTGGTGIEMGVMEPEKELGDWLEPLCIAALAMISPSHTRMKRGRRLGEDRKSVV